MLVLKALLHRGLTLSVR